MRSVLTTMKDEYNCMTDLMPIDPKTLVEHLTKIEAELRLVTSRMKPEDRQNIKGQPDPHKESCSNRKRALAESSHKLNDPILRIP